MGKRDVRMVRVPKWATALLWTIVAAAMADVIYVLSGHAYLQERVTLADLAQIVRRGGVEEWIAVLASVAPLVLDVLFFVPFGALTFLAIDRKETSRTRSYGVTLAVGVAFALVLTVWQQALPTRVTGWIDAIWNVAGCLAGAVLGHARKRIRIRFE